MCMRGGQERDFIVSVSWQTLSMLATESGVPAGVRIRGAVVAVTSRRGKAQGQPRTVPASRDETPSASSSASTLSCHLPPVEFPLRHISIVCEAFNTLLERVICEIKADSMAGTGNPSLITRAGVSDSKSARPGDHRSTCARTTARRHTSYGSLASASRMTCNLNCE